MAITWICLFYYRYFCFVFLFCSQRLINYMAVQSIDFSVYDESLRYSRNRSCGLNYLFTFLICSFEQVWKIIFTSYAKSKLKVISTPNIKEIKMYKIVCVCVFKYKKNTIALFARLNGRVGIVRYLHVESTCITALCR